MGITSDFEMAAMAPDDALAKAVRDPMASPISQIAALSELRNRQQLRQEASAMQASQQPTVADQTLAPIGYARGGLVQGFADGSKGPVKQPRDIQIDPYYRKLVNDYIARAEQFESKGNPNARPIYKGEVLSSASGRFQMIDSTRRNIDRRYGFDPKDRSDETERKRMKVYTNDTINALEKAGMPITGGTLYAGHLLGQQGAEKFLRAYSNDPSARAQDFFDPEVIRVNPAIFGSKRNGKLTTQTDKTLDDVMAKLDSVGMGGRRTPRTQEDSNIGAAMQFANRIDTGDTGAGYQSGPGYEDANLALATALAQNPDLVAPIPRREAPQQQTFFYNPSDGGPAYNPASEAEDMEILDAAQKRDQDRMRRYREQSMGSMSGFRDGGIVQHFADGGPIRRPDGSLVLPITYPYDRFGTVQPDGSVVFDIGGPQTAPNYDPLAYTGTLLGQPDMPPSPEPMTGMEAIGAMTDYFRRNSYQPSGDVPFSGPPPVGGVAAIQPGADYLSRNAFVPSGEIPFSGPPQPGGLSIGTFQPSGEAPFSDPLISSGRMSGGTPVNLPEGFAPSAEDAYKAYRSSRDESLQRIRDIAAQKNPYKGATGALLYEIGRFGDQLLTGAIPAGIDTLGMGVTGLYGTLFEDMQAGAWDEKTGDKKVPIERGGAKTPAPPPSAPPRTKQRAGAPTNAPASGIEAGITPTAPAGGGVGAGGAAGTQPVTTSPYGPMEQFVRDLYARDEERRARMTEREEEAKSMARLKAGLAIMGGKSPYFAQNLANALPVIQQYEQQMAGIAGDEDQFEQELRQRLIGARTGDIQMKAMQDRYNAEARAAEAKSKVEIAELAQKGLLTMDSAFETHLKNLYGQPPEKPGPVADYATARQQAMAMAAQDVRAMRENELYRVNASGNAIKAPGVQ